MMELRSQVASAKFFRKLGYSTCWEDPEVLRQALMVNSDDHVLSITSAGDLSIGLLLEDPPHGSQVHDISLDQRESAVYWR